MCSGSVRECVVCVRVCEGACTKVQCVYKWCVRECVHNGCVYRGFSKGCVRECVVCGRMCVEGVVCTRGVRGVHRV